jgi:alanine racemase
VGTEFTRFKNLHVEGLMTHFAAADDLTDEYMNAQMLRFAEAVSIFHEVSSGRSSIWRFTGRSASDSRLRWPGRGILYGLGDDVLPEGIETNT